MIEYLNATIKVRVFRSQIKKMLSAIQNHDETWPDISSFVRAAIERQLRFVKELDEQEEEFRYRMRRKKRSVKK